MSRRGNPSSLWRSVVLQRVELKPGQQQRARLTAENDDLPQTIFADWVHPTRSILCSVDEKTGVWMVDVSMRKPNSNQPQQQQQGAAAAAQAAPRYGSSQQQQNVYGEVFFRGTRNGHATAACTVLPQHAGFTEMGNEIAEKIVGATRNAQRFVAVQQKQQTNETTTRYLLDLATPLPVGAMATSLGTVMAFSTSEMLPLVRWTCTADESVVMDEMAMSNHVVPRFRGDGGIVSASRAAPVGSKLTSAPFCFAVAWAKKKNYMFVCFALQEAETTVTSFSSGDDENITTTTLKTEVRIATGPVVVIYGSSWSPFFSDITGLCSSSDSLMQSSFSYGSRQRIGWVSRNRQVHGLYVDTTPASPENLAKLRKEQQQQLGGGGGGATAAWSSSPGSADFSSSVDGPAAASAFSPAADGGGASAVDIEIPLPVAETQMAFEAPFLFFKESIPCIRELGPFAIDLDLLPSHQQQQQQQNGGKNGSSNISSSSSSSNATSLLGVPRRRLETAVICTRGAMARILMKKDTTKKRSSSSDDNNNAPTTTAVNSSSRKGKAALLQQQQEQRMRLQLESDSRRVRDVAAVEAWFNAEAANKKENGSGGEPFGATINGQQHQQAHDQQQQQNQQQEEPEQLELVSQVEVPGGEGYITTLAVSPSGTVVAFGFETGIITVAFCGAHTVGTTTLTTTGGFEQQQVQQDGAGTAANPGISMVSAARRHAVPQLLFLTRTCCRTPGVSPSRLVIDERRASVLCLDKSGTLEMLLFPSDLRAASAAGSSSGTPVAVCSSVHRIAAAQKVGPLDKPLKSALEPMRTAGCVGVNPGLLTTTTATANAASLQQRSLEFTTASSTLVGSTVSGAALRRCAQLEEVEMRAFLLALKATGSSSSSAARQRIPLQLSDERRNTAAATTLDRHFFEGNFAPHFNPYTCVCLQDAGSSGSSDVLLVGAAQLLSAVEQARAQAFARAAPSLAPSTVAAKFRAVRGAVASRIKRFSREQQIKENKKKEEKDAAAAAAGGSSRAGGEVMMQPRAPMMVPWKDGDNAGDHHHHHRRGELATVDAESIHEAREALALARYLVPDHATATYCSPYSVPP